MNGQEALEAMTNEMIALQGLLSGVGREEPPAAGAAQRPS